MTTTTRRSRTAKPGPLELAVDTVVAPEPGTELAIAAALANFKSDAERIDELRQQLAATPIDCSTPEGDKIARESRRTLVSLRVGIDNRRLELGRPLLTQKTAIDEHAKGLIGSVVEMETPIDDKIKAQEEQEEARKEEKRKAERERLAVINVALVALRGYALAFVGKSADAVRDAIDELAEQVPTAELYAEFLPEAESQHATQLAKLAELLAAAEQREQLEADLQAQRDREAAERAMRERCDQIRRASLLLATATAARLNEVIDENDLALAALAEEEVEQREAREALRADLLALRDAAQAREELQAQQAAAETARQEQAARERAVAEGVARIRAVPLAFVSATSAAVLVEIQRLQAVAAAFDDSVHADYRSATREVVEQLETVYAAARDRELLAQREAEARANAEEQNAQAQRELEAARAQAAAQEAETLRQAEARHLADVTLDAAIGDVLKLLDTLGASGHIATRALLEAWGRERPVED